MARLGCSGVAAIAATLGVAAAADGYEFRHRFVWNANGVDIPIRGQFELPVNSTRRIRLQFGVFDDANGPAPEGGFVGWNVGTLFITPGSQWTMTRTPGRLVPFVFSPVGNGNPSDSSFIEGWQDIDATLGTQVPAWPPGSDPDNPPPPVIRGRNEWCSVYEVTVTPIRDRTYVDGELSFGGNLIAASEWRTVGTPIPPEGDEYGQITYAPYPLPPVAVSGRLRLLTIPIPGAPTGAALIVGVALFHRRRR